jgi:hypothetical protein
VGHSPPQAHGPCLQAARGHAAAARLWADIRSLVVHALKAVAPVIINDKHSFEVRVARITHGLSLAAPDKYSSDL